MELKCFGSTDMIQNMAHWRLFYNTVTNFVFHTLSILTGWFIAKRRKKALTMKQRAVFLYILLHTNRVYS